jgi:D-alanyl-lipoteichoic acid acyltransferase DltB (MBOAT superfamily)
MLFNSFEYLIFLPLVFIFYWIIKPENFRWQNFMLIVASYIFYAWWDYRFLFLLIFSTSLDYFTGLKIFQARTPKRKKIWLFISIGINLGFLGFFKYYNFFIESFAELLHSVGFQPHIWTLKLILPVGISFYTFHGLSYVLDIYREKIKPTRNIVDYSLFVSFFPLLVAGPIERATHLLPQLQKPRVFNYTEAVSGLRQILWGFFKKMVIADNCAPIVNWVFDNHETMPPCNLALGAVLFAFQIYGDFSGYSDIALGSARLLGIELLKNFSYPYFARDIAEFWRRWHISLTTWFRDYLYIPLGGSRVSKAKAIRNTFIIFIVSGFWHGANWTFLAWGCYHALLFIPLLIMHKNRKNTNTVAEHSIFPTCKELIYILLTFSLVVIGWIIFRADNISVACTYIGNIFANTTSHLFDIGNMKRELLYATIAIFLLLITEWINRKKDFGLASLYKNRLLRWAFYILLTSMIIEMGDSQQDFIYFQF